MSPFLRRLSLLALVALTGCPPVAADCASTCSGCCDSNGTCQPGVTPTACGPRGNVCSTCALGDVCSFGACVSRLTSEFPAGGGGNTDSGVAFDSGVVLDSGLALPDAGSETDAGVDAGVCPSGFQTDGARCVDVNECATNNGGCAGACVNTSGSFTCSAVANACATNNGGCDLNATCVSTSGTRTCTCKPGFSGDGVTCSPAGVRRFAVVRVGNPTFALSTAPAEVHLERRRVDGVLLNEVALPTTTSGGHQPLTVTGVATTEGILSLSGDGRFLVLAGNAVAPGVPLQPNTPKVIARVAVDGPDIDTTTLINDAYVAQSVRCAATHDGTMYWVGGSTDGVRLVVHGSMGVSTAISTTRSSLRALQVNAGQLWGSAATSVFQVGSGLPMASVLPNDLPFSVVPSDAAGFAKLDRNPSVPGDDLLYLVEFGTRVVHRYDFNGTQWLETATFSASSGSATAVVAWQEAGQVSLLVSGTFGVLRFSDDDVPGPHTGTRIVPSPGANQVYRGLVLLP